MDLCREEDEWMLFSKAGSVLGVSKATMYRWMEQGLLTSKMEKGHRYIKSDTVHAAKALGVSPKHVTVQAMSVTVQMLKAKLQHLEHKVTRLERHTNLYTRSLVLSRDDIAEIFAHASEHIREATDPTELSTRRPDNYWVFASNYWERKLHSMTPEVWGTIEEFSPKTNGGDILRAVEFVIQRLDTLVPWYSGGTSCVIAIQDSIRDALRNARMCAWINAQKSESS
jgi:hypothetical protein